MKHILVNTANKLIVSLFTSATAALTAAKGDKNLVVFAVDAKEFDGLLTADLLAMYNKLTGENVARFSTRDAGIKRLLKAIEAMPVTLPAVDHSASNARIAALLEQTDGPVVEVAGTPMHTHRRKNDPKPDAITAPRTRRVTPVEPLPCREGSKQAKLVDMLSRPEGATIPELMTALGWTDASVRAGFSWDLVNKGYGVTKADATGHYFLIIPAGHTIPAHIPLKKAAK